MTEVSNQYSQNNTGDATGIQADVSRGEVYQGKTVNVTKNYFSESQPALKLGAPFLAPPLPDYYVPRPEHSDVVKAELLATGEKATGTLVVSAIYGLGGIGKSVLATALAHDPEVQAHFKEGVLWVTLGQEPDLLPKLGGWLHALGDYNSKPTSMDVAVTQLRLLLQEKQMLLVIDDVWEPGHAEPFRVGGSSCCVLITTREAQIKNAKAHNLDEMTPEQALQMLKQRLPERELTLEDEEKAQLLAKAVGYLPLALELAAAQVEDEVSWGELLEDLQAEIADLASFDGSGLALKMGKDEKQLRDRSLLASFNLSLKRLPREQLEQFAWLGIVQEDAEINKTMASQLWGMKSREAKELLTFFKRKALLMPGVGRQEQATYRTHDLVRSISKRLLTSPAEGDGGFAFVGFETSLAEAHSILLERYREATVSGLWHELEDDGYIFAQLTWHMDQAGQEVQIHQLFQETTAEGRNGWYEACDRLGKLSYFVTDLGRAWALAEELFEQDATEAIVLQWRYALIQTTLNSLAQNIPARLLARFVETGFWSGAQGIAYAKQIQIPEDGCKAIAQLVTHLPESLLPEALKLTGNISDQYGRAHALRALTKELPISLLPDVLEVTSNITDDYPRAEALSSLIPQLPESLLNEALVEVIRTINNEYPRAWLLATLAEQLPELWSEALETTRAIKNEADRAKTLRSIAKELPESMLPEVLELTRTITFQPELAKTLGTFAENLPELWPEVLELTNKITNTRNRILLLGTFAKHLPELWPEVLELTRRIDNEADRAVLLSSFAEHMPDFLLFEAWEITRNINDEVTRTKTLGELASHHLLNLLLPQAFNLIRNMKSEVCRARALSALAKQLPESLLLEALELTHSIQYEIPQAEALHTLANHLPISFLSEALKLTHSLNDNYARARVLGNLVKQLPELWPEFFTVTRNIKDESLRRKALSACTDILPEFLLPNALEVTRNIQDEYQYTQALCTLAEQLPELWPEALETTRAIKNEADRAQTFCALAAHMPELWPEALHATRNIEDEEVLVEVLNVLIKHSSKHLLTKILEITRNISDEYQRTQVLCTLAEQLPELWPEALEATRAIKNEFSLALMLIRLAAHLPELWSEAWNVTSDIQDESRRETALAMLIKYSPNSKLSEALAVANNIKDESKRTKALCALAEQLPELWPEVLKALRQIKDEFSLVMTLKDLAPHLAKFLMPETLEITSKIQSEDHLASALKFLAKYLPESLLTEALEMTHKISDEAARILAFRALAPYFAASQIEAALKEINDFKALSYQASALSAVLSRLNISKPASWQATLRILSARKRPELIQDLPKLESSIVALGGKTAFDGSLQAMREVCKQWK